MYTTHLDQAYRLYLKANPKLSPEQLGVVLLIDSFYQQLPADLPRFRTLYRHLDPSIIDEAHEGITFLKISATDVPDEELKRQLNDYINIKFRSVGHGRSYEENMVMFRSYVRMVSASLDEILQQAELPAEIVDVLRERERVRRCEDFFDLLQLYRSTKSKRVHFEILRKIGLIVLASRVSRHFIEADLRLGIQQVSEAFLEGLGCEPIDSPFTCHFWIDCAGELNYSFDHASAAREHAADRKWREKLPLQAHELQSLEFSPFRTRDGAEILLFQIRNKLERAGRRNYTSALEKIARKNLQYPKDLLDVIAVRLIVREESGIPALVGSLERFLGGSSTRKEKKNTLHRFGRQKLSAFSSPDYSVWKAIYDIALPHPSIVHVRKLMEMTRGNEAACAELQQRLNFFLETPKDSVVEVQLQDLPSFLLGIAHGSPAEHNLMKSRQIRMNSLYKFFPEEVYRTELEGLQEAILHGGSELLSLPG